ncbi:MAG: alpha/beta hydrolase [Acetobacteraceae bacterium]|nr:alpha/beta hydrolase [Acetobacteraceae bacterium]
MQERRAILAAGIGAGFGAAVPAPRLRPAQAQAPAAQAPAAQPALPHRRHTVRTPDGVEIAAYKYGNAQGQPILFIHGYMQAALSWDRQTRDPELAREFRLVAYDIRGHGMSTKPEGDPFYKPGQVWADEVKGVIDTLGLQRPVLVGWSYGGRIMGDYLNAHGHGAIGGVDWVGATSSVAETPPASAAAGAGTGRTAAAAPTRRPRSATRSPSCGSASRSSPRPPTSRPCSPSTAWCRGMCAWPCSAGRSTSRRGCARSTFPCWSRMAGSTSSSMSRWAATRRPSCRRRASPSTS